MQTRQGRPSAIGAARGTLVSGVRLRTLAGRAARLGAYLPSLAVAAVLATVVVLAVDGQLDPFSSPGPGSGPPPGIVTAGSSWVSGEPSLADSPQFAAIEQRAEILGNRLWAAREALIAEIAAAKRAAAARRRSDLLKKYAALRAKELAAYHAALLRIQLLRAEQERKLAAERKRYQEALAKYMRARTVTPGKECKDPAVQQSYSCQNGLLPASSKVTVKQSTTGKRP